MIKKGIKKKVRHEVRGKQIILLSTFFSPVNFRSGTVFSTTSFSLRGILTKAIHLHYICSMDFGFSPSSLHDQMEYSLTGLAVCNR